tara:strand:- start:77 stop:595 length:519 start_codon:yes stop_codon:yes gene_type:complete
MKGILPELKGSVDNISPQYSVLHELNSRINHSDIKRVYNFSFSTKELQPYHSQNHYSLNKVIWRLRNYTYDLSIYASLDKQIFILPESKRELFVLSLLIDTFIKENKEDIVGSYKQCHLIKKVYTHMKNIGEISRILHNYLPKNEYMIMIELCFTLFTKCRDMCAKFVISNN